MNYALTMYPLSGAFRGRLRQALAGEPEYLSVSELRSRPLKEILTRLRSLGGARLVLPIEDEHSRSILPILIAVAACSNAERIEIRHADLRAERVRRSDLFRSGLAIASASARVLRDAAVCSREVTRLLRAPRIEARCGASDSALYVNANLWFGLKAGGSVGHVAGVVNALQRKTNEVRYASAGGSTMIDRGVTTVALDAPDVFGFPMELNHYTFHRLVSRQLKLGGVPNFIYQRMSMANYAGVKLSREWGVPLVLEYNGSEVWAAKHWGRRLSFESLATKAEDVCLQHAHVVVTISEALRDELVARGVSPKRIVCYPNCIDPAVFDPARFSDLNIQSLRRKLNVASAATLVTFVGTFGPWHGADVMARAVRQLADTEPDWLRRNQVRFLFVGDGQKMPIVREILGADCGDLVTMTGLVAQNEAPAYLAASDILLSPHVGNADGSRFFGSPTKLFEYMAMGKAVIASDLDQIGQVLHNSVRAGELNVSDPDASERRMAVLFPPGDVAALVESIKFAVDRPMWRRTLGANARAEALAKYTWSHHVSAILDRLADLAG